MEELEAVNGGNWFTDAVDATCSWVDDHRKGVVKGLCVVGGIALCATGIGAGAGLGLIAVEGVAGAAFAATTGGTLIGATTGAIITKYMDD